MTGCASICAHVSVSSWACALQAGKKRPGLPLIFIAPQRPGFGLCGPVPAALSVIAYKNQSITSSTEVGTDHDAYDLGVAELDCGGACKPVLLYSTL